MAGAIVQELSQRVWALVRAQHGVIARRQLLALGFTRHAIEHRIRRGKLHPLWPSVYAVGRPEVSREGRWMAAVLACGEDAGLGFATAAGLWGFADVEGTAIDVAA